MFNFSANHIKVLNSKSYDKCIVYSVMDLDTSRCYKAYDYKKSIELSKDQVYCISGKINSADKLYLILESSKSDNKFCLNH